MALCFGLWSDRTSKQWAYVVEKLPPIMVVQNTEKKNTCAQVIFLLFPLDMISSPQLLGWWYLHGEWIPCFSESFLETLSPTWTEVSLSDLLNGLQLWKE